MIGISRATYYNKPVREAKQIQRDLELKNIIEDIHSELLGYGYRRVREHLLREGKTVNTLANYGATQGHPVCKDLYNLFTALIGKIESKISIDDYFFKIDQEIDGEFQKQSQSILPLLKWLYHWSLALGLK